MKLFTKLFDRSNSIIHKIRTNAPAESVIYAHDDSVIDLDPSQWSHPDRKMRKFTPGKEQQL